MIKIICDLLFAAGTAGPRARYVAFSAVDLVPRLHQTSSLRLGARVFVLR
jgi:hypothetical protein